jgi:hypothetical protein
MAIVTPTDLVPVPVDAIALSNVAGKLTTVLQNTNYLYRYHRPAALSVAYWCQSDITGRDARFTIPFNPSVDGLSYVLRHHVLATSLLGGATITASIETHTVAGGWVAAASDSAAIAAGSNQHAIVDHHFTIDPAVDMLRVTYSTTAGWFTPHHLLAYPFASSPTAGIKQSGFVPFDDGILVGATGGAVHTEFIERAQTNALAILRDRAQCAFALVQEDDHLHMVTKPDGASSLNWTVFPTARVGFCGQNGDLTLEVSMLCDVSRGTARNNLVNLYQVGGSSCTCSASGGLETTTLKVNVDGGALDAYADLELRARAPDALTQTWVYAVVAWWRPTL